MHAHLSEIKEIVNQGLCHRCGACSGICPAAVIEPDDDYYPSWQSRTENCTDCGLCVRACPGRECSFPELSRTVLGREADVRQGHGTFLKAFLGYAADPDVRAGSTSGGIATQLPIHLLRTGQIAGAVAVRSDPRQPWKPAAFVARSGEEIREGRLSKYPACSLDHLFQALRDENGPFALTGIPCQIHGFRKMAMLSPPIGRKVALTVGLFCHSCLDHQALRDIMECYGIRDADIAEFLYRSGKLPGYIRARTRAGQWVSLPYPHLDDSRYRPNAKECLTLFFKFYSPPRCRLCIDATAEFADISIGDPWVKGWEGMPRFRQGYNMILARTERGLRALEDARQAGAIVLEPLPESLSSAGQSLMATRKRLRGLYNIRRRSRQGLACPDYGFDKRWTPGEMWRASAHAATYFAADRPGLRRPIVRFLLSRIGRFAVGLVFFRRRVLQAAWEQRKARAGVAGQR